MLGAFCVQLAELGVAAVRAQVARTISALLRPPSLGDRGAAVRRGTKQLRSQGTRAGTSSRPSPAAGPFPRRKPCRRSGPTAVRPSNHARLISATTRSTTCVIGANGSRFAATS